MTDDEQEGDFASVISKQNQNMWGAVEFTDFRDEFSVMVPEMAKAGETVVLNRASQQKYSQADAYQHLLGKFGADCPIFCRAVQWMLVYAENSASCECGFSLMNRVKTTHRNLLSHDTLRDIMTIISCPISPEKIDYRQILRDFSSVELDRAA